MLKQHRATSSVSRKENPYDNAACESFMKMLKYEEVYRNEYHDFHDARASIGEFLSGSIINNDCIRPSGMFRQPSSRRAPRRRATHANCSTGASAPATPGFTPGLLRQNGSFTGRLMPPQYSGRRVGARVA